MDWMAVITEVSDGGRSLLLQISNRDGIQNLLSSWDPYLLRSQYRYQLEKALLTSSRRLSAKSHLLLLVPFCSLAASPFALNVLSRAAPDPLLMDKSNRQSRAQSEYNLWIAMCSWKQRER